MMRILSITALLLLAACTNGDGQRCNPLRATNDCDPGLFCVFPASPSCNPTEPGSNCCGVSYCCQLDANGNITDTNPNCAPDPSAVLACFPDMAVTPTPDLAMSIDGGH